VSTASSQFLGPNAFVIRSTDGAFDVLTANSATGVVSSAQLTPAATNFLTQRLQQFKALFAALSSDGFKGLVRNLVAIDQVEGDFSSVVTVNGSDYTLSVSGLAIPGNLLVSIPFSTSSMFTGNAASPTDVKNFPNGLESYGFNVALLGVIPAAGLDVYVDANGGDDDNDGLSEATALQTLEARFLKFPSRLLTGGGIRTWLAAVGGFGANATAPQEYYVANIHLSCIGSYVNGDSFRGAWMVPITPQTGPASKTVSSATGLWTQVNTDGAAGRTRTASVGTPGAGYALFGTRLLVSGINWTTNNLQGWYARITRAGLKVVFEFPICGNGANHVDLDFADRPDGVTFMSQVTAGDTVEVVRPSVKLRSDPGEPHLKSISITGGGAYGTYDPDQGSWTTRGGPNGFTFERIEFSGACNWSGVFGWSCDRCMFTDGDTNFRGGGGQFCNCISRGPTDGATNSSGVQMQGQWSNIHDLAGCRPDSAADPINQDIDDPMMELLVCQGALFVLGNGGGFSAGAGCSYTMERNISVYGSAAAAAIKVWRSYFYMPSPASVRNRRLLLQGDDNVGLGVKLTTQSYMKVNNDQCRLRGAGFDDVGLGTFTKTWLEAQTFVHTDPGCAVGHWVQAFSGSILTNADP